MARRRKPTNDPLLDKIDALLFEHAKEQGATKLGHNFCESAN